MSDIFSILAHHSPWISDRVLFICRAGSHAYGTNIEWSDEDFRGACVAPPYVYHGFAQGFEQLEVKDPDIVIYECRKFFTIAAKGNPNAVESLFVDPSDRLFVSPVGERIFKQRDVFLSKRIISAVMGYAKGAVIGLDRPDRVGKRAQLIARFGYDTKDAACVVRLLRMAREWVETGTLTIKRPDATELLSIRHGGWTLARVRDYVGGAMDDLGSARERCRLPDSPDMTRLNDLCCEVVEAML